MNARLFCAIGLAAIAQAQTRPTFEDFPAPANGNYQRQPLNLKLRSERMFRTRLTAASLKPADFADHFKFAVWGCGSNCAAAAFVDLQNGVVYSTPLSGRGEGWGRWVLSCGMFDGAGFWGRVDSRLVIARCGGRWSEKENRWLPDTYYFVFEDDKFRQLKKIAEDKSDLPASATELLP